MIHSNSTATWGKIFSFLGRHAGEVRGRSEDHKTDFRHRLELFANGEIPDGEIDELCAKISASPDAMEALARILSEREKNLPD
jgi:hypothetical protein